MKIHERIINSLDEKMTQQKLDKLVAFAYEVEELMQDYEIDSLLELRLVLQAYYFTININSRVKATQQRETLIKKFKKEGD